MANYANILAEIAAAITTNDNQEITGAVLNTVLGDMTETIKDGGYIFAGIGSPATSPGAPDANVWYIGPAGTYTNFGASVGSPFVVNDGEIGVFLFNGTWTRQKMEITAALDIVNNVYEGGADRLLSAEMGKFLQGEIVGEQPEINNDNATSSDYSSYTDSGNTRGYFVLGTTGDDQYAASVNVHSDSTVKVGIQLRSSSGLSTGLIYDTGWVTPGNSASVTQANGSSSVKYIFIVATYVSGNTGVPTLSELKNNVDFTMTAGPRSGGLVPEIEEAQEDIAALEDEVFGVNETVTVTDENFSAADYSSYSSGGNTRGQLLYTMPANHQFTLTLAVAANSPIKAAVQGRPTPTTFGYDSYWLSPGSSFTANPANFSSDNYIALVFTYNDSGTGIPTVSEIRTYIDFSLSYGSRKLSLREYIRNFRNFTKDGIIAHRGFHLNDVPENSIDAYRFAGYAKADFAETDFCPTSDKQLVLMHDSTINRTMRNAADYSQISGSVSVADKTLSQLQAGYVLIANDKRYRRTIPLLSDFFKTCWEYGVFPLPEIKQSGTTTEDAKNAFDMGCEILGEGNFGFCSFSYALLDYVRSISDRTPLFYIGASILNTLNTVTGESRNDPLNVWYPEYTAAAVTAATIANYHSKGMMVAVWTVPVAQYDAVKKKGVDIIASDHMQQVVRNPHGTWLRSDAGFSDFTTDGTVTDDALQLASGESVSFTGSAAWLGGYYLEIIGKGSFTVTAPNLSTTVSSASVDTFRFEGTVDNTTIAFTITATAATEIQFVNFKHITF